MLWEVISPSAIYTWPPLSCFALVSAQVHNIQCLQQKALELHTAQGSRAGSQLPSQTGASSSFFIPQQFFQGQALTLCRSQCPREMLSVTGEAGSENERLWAASRVSRAPSGSVWMMFLCLARILTQIRAGARWGLCGCLARAFPATVHGARAQLQK